MHGYPQVLIPRALAKFGFLRKVLNRAKMSLLLLVGTTHSEPEYLEMRRTYAQ